MNGYSRFYFVIFLINCINSDSITYTDDNFATTTSLLDADDVSGSHVDICCNQFDGYINWKRNATGHTISKNGVTIEMVDWLSISMKFKYECLPQKDSDRFTFDNETKTEVWTSLYQLKHGLCHISPQPFVITYARFKDFSDFLSPFGYTQFNILIPIPERAIGGFSSVWRPFEVSVWTALLVSIAVTMILSLVNWLYSRSRTTTNQNKLNEVSLDIHWLFLFGLLMSKAGFRAPESFKMRLSGGAWCIAALILTIYYSSILTSLITTSSPVPIVNSVKELANHDRIELIIVKGFGAAAIIADGLNNSLIKKLDVKIKSSTNSICADQASCYRQVVEKKNTAFLHNEPSLFAMVSEDYRTTRRCNAAFAKEPFQNKYVAWPISKNYSQFEAYQRGMLRMMETGLVGYWKNMYLPRPYQCMVDPSSRQAMLDDIRNPALVDLHGLFPTFVFLFIGFFLALIALSGEWIKKLGIMRNMLPFFRSQHSNEVE